MNPPVSTPTTPRRLLYWASFTIAALVNLFAMGFFIVGLADGSVSPFNMPLWLSILAAAAAVLFVGHRLHLHGRTGLAIAVLAILAVPGLLYGLFALMMIVNPPHWN